MPQALKIDRHTHSISVQTLTSNEGCDGSVVRIDVTHPERIEVIAIQMRSYSARLVQEIPGRKISSSRLASEITVGGDIS